jgi:hypothetical protein
MKGFALVECGWWKANAIYYAVRRIWRQALEKLMSSTLDISQSNAILCRVGNSALLNSKGETKMPQKKRTRSERFLDDVAKLVKEFDFLNTKITKDFIKLVQEHSAEIDSKLGTNFIEMVLKRQAAKYAGMSEAEFKAQMKALLEKQQEIFNRSQKLSKEDLAEIERMKAKAKTTKAENAANRVVDDLLNS